MWVLVNDSGLIDMDKVGKVRLASDQGGGAKLIFHGDGGDSTSIHFSSSKDAQLELRRIKDVLERDRRDMANRIYSNYARSNR